MLPQAKRAYWLLHAFVRAPAPYLKLWFRIYPRAFVARAFGAGVGLNGIKVPVGRYCSFRLAREIVGGSYERPERNLLREHLQDGDRVLELGTGIGVVATMCAQRLGSERVFTFEANPALLPIARRTFLLNGVAPAIENCILARTEGEARFYVEKHFWSSSTVRRSSSAREVRVPARELADAIATIRPTFLIVDIEGGEADMFESVELEGVMKVLIELHPHVVGDERIGRVKRAFERAGYRAIQQLSDGTQVLYQRGPR